MDEKYKIGDFGLMEFMSRPGSCKKNWFNIPVTVMDIDRYYLFVKDNNGTSFLVQKRYVKKWVKQEFKNLLV